MRGARADNEAPLVLLPGVALLVLSTSARYAQLHGEFHHLER